MLDVLPLVPKSRFFAARWYGRMSHVIEPGFGGHALTERPYISGNFLECSYVVATIEIVLNL